MKKSFRDVMAYLQDNPEGYWFKNKMYGLGWTPATKEGWFVMGAFVLWAVAVTVRFEVLNLPEELVVQHIVFPIFFGVFVLLVVTWKTGEPLRWTWHGKNNLNKSDESPTNN